MIVRQRGLHMVLAQMAHPVRSRGRLAFHGSLEIERLMIAQLQLLLTAMRSKYLRTRDADDPKRELFWEDAVGLVSMRLDGSCNK